MNKLLLGTLPILMLIGCTSAPIQQQTPVDQEPLLVGIPISERVASTKTTIDNQFQLLSKVRSGQYAGKFEMVTHNNELDARKGARTTIPAAYNQVNSKPVVEESVSVVADGNKVVVKETVKDAKRTVKIDESCNPKLQEKVKLIVWNNDSANKLGKNFADALGYSFVVSGDSDTNVSIRVENDTIQTAINSYKEQLKGKAEVVIIDKNKTFNIIYKK